MKVRFKTRLEAIEWIANRAKDEGQFEVLREKLLFNYIYTGTYFLDLSKKLGEVVMMDKSKK